MPELDYESHKPRVQIETISMTAELAIQLVNIILGALLGRWSGTNYGMGNMIACPVAVVGGFLLFGLFSIRVFLHWGAFTTGEKFLLLGMLLAGPSFAIVGGIWGLLNAHGS